MVYLNNASLPTKWFTFQSMAFELYLLALQCTDHYLSNNCSSWPVANHITSFKVRLWLVTIYLLIISRGTGPRVAIFWPFGALKMPCGWAQLVCSIHKFFQHIVINSEPQFKYLLIWPWTGHLVTLSISFLIFKMGIICFHCDFKTY